jgi:hypothetical protein
VGIGAALRARRCLNRSPLGPISNDQGPTTMLNQENPVPASPIRDFDEESFHLLCPALLRWRMSWRRTNFKHKKLFKISISMIQI